LKPRRKKEVKEKKPKKEPKEGAKKPGKGFGKNYLKPALAIMMGMDSCGRTDVVKEIWRHAKLFELQDPKDKRYICCDERLFAVFQKKRIHMFTMNKDLNKHFGERVGNEKADDIDDEADDDDTDQGEGGSSKRKAKSEPKESKKPAEKKAKKSGDKKPTGGFAAPVRLSESLQNLLDPPGDSLPRCEVVKQLWAYIKSNELQNPENKSQILPDAKMKKVFGKSPFTGFAMMKLLKEGEHLTKIEK